MLIKLVKNGCIGAADNGDGSYRLDFPDHSRLATAEEIAAAQLEVDRAAIKTVSRRQMLTALHRVGLLDTIKAAVAGSGDMEMQIAFDEALEFERGNAFIAAMAATLNKTDAEIDDIFALAASI